jgi:ketopantoate hydroxymethyltransferase
MPAVQIRDAAGTRPHSILARHVTRRYTARQPVGLKVNLYTGVEVEGLARMVHGPVPDAPMECVMVGDSFFSTHLGRPSTRLATVAEQAWGLSILIAQVAEVRVAMDTLLPADTAYLLADLPDGTLDDTTSAMTAARRMVDAGADAVKVEVADLSVLGRVECIAGAGVPVVAHLGYTPQRGAPRRRGDDYDDARRLFAAARRARDAGACAVVLEMVSEVVNRALNLPAPDSLPVYSIFSGSAPYCGQTLNVWDAVFRPPTPRRYFPPTATLEPCRDRSRYTAQVVADHLTDLVRLTLDGAFPLSPPTRLTAVEQYALLTSGPWQAG